MRSEVVVSERQIVRNIPITQVTAISTANNTNVGRISVKSSVAADAMKITIWGILSGQTTITTEELTIAGTAAVTTTATTYSQFYGAFLGYKDGRLSSRSTGTITISNGAGFHCLLRMPRCSVPPGFWSVHRRCFLMGTLLV